MFSGANKQDRHEDSAMPLVYTLVIELSQCQRTILFSGDNGEELGVVLEGAVELASTRTSGPACRPSGVWRTTLFHHQQGLPSPKPNR